MMGTTHQLMALLLAVWLLTLYPLAAGPVVATLAIIAVMVGALTPDLDQPTANLWRRLLGGRALGTIFQAFSGGHRHITHSLIGIVLVALATRWFINEVIADAYATPAQLVWQAYLIGYISHPIADTLTDRGVPWLWPLKWHLKIPPGPEELRVTTDSLVERLLVRGGVMIALLVLMSSHWPTLKYFFS